MKNTKKVNPGKSLPAKTGQDDYVSELTIEQKRGAALESFEKDRILNNKIVLESGDETELTIEDVRDAGLEVMKSEDEIEKYKP